MTVILAAQNAGESCELGASLDYTAKIHLKKKREKHILTPFYARVSYLKFLLTIFIYCNPTYSLKSKSKDRRPFPDMFSKGSWKNQSEILQETTATELRDT